MDLKLLIKLGIIKEISEIIKSCSSNLDVQSVYDILN